MNKVTSQLLLCLSLITGAGSSWVRAQGDFTYFFYLSDRRIITLELASTDRVILNYINIGDTFALLEAPRLVILDGAGRVYRGQLFLNDDPDVAGAVFTFSHLLEPDEFAGFDIVGNFRLEARPSRVLLEVGSRILELEPITSAEFDEIAERIGQLDLAAEDEKASILSAGFWQGHGQAHRPESEEYGELSTFFRDIDVLPPQITENPPPKLRSEFAGLPDPVLVQLRVRVTNQGGIVGIEVVEAPNEELAQQAVATVRNSWRFLPAISNGKASAAEMVLRVRFQR